MLRQDTVVLEALDTQVVPNETFTEKGIKSKVRQEARLSFVLTFVLNRRVIVDVFLILSQLFLKDY